MLHRPSSIVARSFVRRSVHVEAKLKELGIELGSPLPPKGNYMPYVQSGKMIYLAGI